MRLGCVSSKGVKIDVKEVVGLTLEPSHARLGQLFLRRDALIRRVLPNSTFGTSTVHGNTALQVCERTKHVILMSHLKGRVCRLSGRNDECAL